MIVEYQGYKIDLGPNPSKQCKRRWQGTMSPEPETVAWIESLPKGVFYDIGANVGRFSIMAALLGHEVHAFEPMWLHVNELTNIRNINKLPIAICSIALADWNGQGYIGAGRSNWTIYKTTEKEFDTVVVYTLDKYISESGLLGSISNLDLEPKPLCLSKPDYIKLDVDGNELQVLKGAKKALKTVKSLLVEIDPVVPGHTTIPALLRDLGFTYDYDQVEACMYKDGKYKGTANWIFRRA